MRILSRTIFREISVSATLGVILFTGVLFFQRATPLFEYLVRGAGSRRMLAYLFALVLPQALPLSIPLGVLVGTLITLSRMSADSEITAMRASGVSGRRVLPPIVTFGILAMLAASAASLWLTPWAIREQYRVLNQLIAGQLTAEVQPRVFAEQFPNKILYIADVAQGSQAKPGSAVRWRRVFVADITPPEKRPPGTERGDNPQITLASEAIVATDAVQDRLQLSLRNGSTYETGKEVTDYRVTAFPTGEQNLQAQKPGEVRVSRAVIETDTIPLYKLAYGTPDLEAVRRTDARIELNERFALPFACVLLALAAVPLGITSRRAGKSSAIVLTVGLAFLYYMGLISLIKLATQGTLPAGIAIWIPNGLFALFGLVMMVRLEAPGDLDVVGKVIRWTRGARPAQVHLPSVSLPEVLDRFQPRDLARKINWRLPLLPGVVDSYVLSEFLFYFALWLVSFVMMTHVFTFFELLSDIIKNRIPMSHVLTYHVFLTPRLIYDFTPISVLVAVLVVFGVLTKNNEVTAFKACGVSAYRLSAPILIAGTVMSGSLFAFDHYWVPEADRRQDAIRAEIKGRPAQTFLRPDRRWIYGLHDRVFYYRYFDQAERVMSGVNVYEIDPVRFRLKRHIFAERARWEPMLEKWVFQNGWSREMDGNNVRVFDQFPGSTRTFDDLEETPDYFVKEVRQSRQMNFRELQAYIAGLQESGFDTVALQVQFYKKFSVPLFALIMAMISIPFAFVAGNRGAMAGVGISILIWIAYWTVGRVFEQMGNLNQLPAEMAAWSPDVVFGLVGMYFLVRMRT